MKRLIIGAVMFILMAMIGTVKAQAPGAIVEQSFDLFLQTEPEDVKAVLYQAISTGKIQYDLQASNGAWFIRYRLELDGSMHDITLVVKKIKKRNLPAQ